MSSSDQQHLGSLHRSIPAALKKFANAFHGGSIVLVDSGSADAIGSAAGFELLAGKQRFFFLITSRAIQRWDHTYS